MKHSIAEVLVVFSALLLVLQVFLVLRSLRKSDSLNYAVSATGVVMNLFAIFTLLAWLSVSP